MTTLNNCIIEVLNKAVEKKALFNIKAANGTINTYHDLSGQRMCYLEKYPNLSNTFLIKRKLEFINEGDEGKEGAILFVLTVNLSNDNSISLSNNHAEINGIRLSFQTRID